MNLAFLDLHNFGSFGGHHGMSTPSYGGSGGAGTLGYGMDRQGHAQALDLATNANLSANGYIPTPIANPTANQSQSRTINPMLTQQVQRVSVPTQLTPVSNGNASNVNVIPGFGSTRQVSQPLALPQLLPMHEQMVGVERTGPARSASVQPTRGMGMQSFSTTPHHSHTHSRGLSAVVSPLSGMAIQKSLEGERGRKRASWGAPMG